MSCDGDGGDGHDGVSSVLTAVPWLLLLLLPPFSSSIALDSNADCLMASLVFPVVPWLKQHWEVCQLPAAVLLDLERLPQHTLQQRWLGVTERVLLQRQK